MTKKEILAPIIGIVIIVSIFLLFIGIIYLVVSYSQTEPDPFELMIIHSIIG